MKQAAHSWPGRSKNRVVAALIVFALASSAALYVVSRGSSGGPPPSFATPVQGGFADLGQTISAINHARNDQDILPAKVAQVADRLGDELLSPDAQNHSMRVFTIPFSGPVYVLPAKDGFAVITGELAEIVPGTLGKTNPAAGWVSYRSDGPGSVFGIASNDVTAVDVIIGTSVYHATMVRNGYYWTAPAVSVDVGAATIHAHLKDGTVVDG